MNPIYQVTFTERQPGLAAQRLVTKPQNSVVDPIVFPGNVSELSALEERQPGYISEWRATRGQNRIQCSSATLGDDIISTTRVQTSSETHARNLLESFITLGPTPNAKVDCTVIT